MSFLQEAKATAHERAMENDAKQREREKFEEEQQATAEAENRLKVTSLVDARDKKTRVSFSKLKSL